ncbi:hypothetical protein [Pelobium manganitolerans]|nr:hypothetical protein [Pelobium manganitolerans]
MKNTFLKAGSILMLAGFTLAACNSNRNSADDTSDSLNAVNSGTGTMGDVADSTDMNGQQMDTLGTDTSNTTMPNR